MSSDIFREGMPHGLVSPMYNDGYAIEPNLVDPEFAAALLDELKAHDKYRPGEAPHGGPPGVSHDSGIVSKLGHMPRLAEYRNTLDEAITEVSGFRREHLTYLTVRVCPVREMSSRIHRNDNAAGPWLVSLTVAGSGSFNIYKNTVIEQGKEKPLTGTESDPKPIASSDMRAGDAWGIYSKEWSAPHAGGLNTSPEPKVLVLLYGWCVRDQYPFRRQQIVQPAVENPPQPAKPLVLETPVKSRADVAKSAVGNLGTYWQRVKQVATNYKQS